MDDDQMTQLGLQLQTIDNLVGNLERHEKLELPSDTRQYLLTYDIISVYNAKAWYELFENNLKGTLPKEERDLKSWEEVNKTITTKKETILKKFDTVRERVCKYILDKEHVETIGKYVADNKILANWPDYLKNAEEPA
jgi:hypothetical protein